MTLGISSEPTVDDCGSVAAGVIESADADSDGSVGKLSHVQRRRIVAGTTKEALQTRTGHRPLEVTWSSAYRTYA